MKRIIAMAILLLGSIIVTSCTPNIEIPASSAVSAPTAEEVTNTEAVQPTPGGTLVISFGGGTPRHFNPALISGSATAIVGTQLFASPLRYDENWNPQPYLAKSWQISDDGLSVTLHLEKDASFHDGVPITSSDVAFSIFVVKENHPFKTMFAPVESVETPDEYTAIIHLSQPHPAILLAMSPALLPILPEHIYGDGQDLATHPANLTPIGSGPFRFVKFVPEEVIELERFDDYFIPERPYLDKLIIRLENDPSAQAVELQRQTAHLVPLFVNPTFPNQLSELDHLILTAKGYEGLGPLGWLAFNLLREPINDIRVRQAIAYAIDPDFIVDYLYQGWAQRAPGPIAPDNPYFDPDIKLYDLDLDKAEKLLDQAGYPRAEDGWRFALTLDYIPAIPTQFHDVALYLKSQLGEIGIQVEIRDSASFPEWAERIGSWDFDLTMDSVYNWGDPVIGVHRSYLSENIRQGVVWSNTQNYSNPKVDEILQVAAIEIDPEKRKALYFELQQILTEELPVIWINVMPFHTIYHAGLGNPPVSIWGVHSPLDDVFWQEQPRIAYLQPPALDPESSYEVVIPTGIKAIQLLQKVDFYAAREILDDPEEEYLDLDVSGLHVIGFTQEGIIFLDNSGQLQAGMDISGLLDVKGEFVLPVLLDAAQNGSLEHLHLEGLWPHPATQALDPVSVWCGMLTANDIVCSLAWYEHEESTP